MLDAMTHEIAEHPERLVPIDAALIERFQSLACAAQTLACLSRTRTFKVLAIKVATSL